MRKRTLAGFVSIILAVSLLLNVNPSTAMAAHGWHKDKNVVSLNDVIVPRDEVVGHVVVIGGNAVVAGTVSHEVIVFDGNLTLQKTARLERFAIVIGGEIVREDGAVVNNGVINLNSDFNNLISVFLAGTMLVLFEAAKLALSGVIIIFIPILAWSLNFIKKAEKLQTICRQNFLKNITLGLLACIAFQLIGTLLAISVVGIPMLIILGVLLIAVALLGLCGLCSAIGAKIAAQTNSAAKPIFIQALYGATALALIANIPFIGLFILTLAVFWGIGAVLVLLFDKNFLHSQ